MILYVLGAVALGVALLFVTHLAATAPTCVRHKPREDWDADDHLHCRKCGRPLPTPTPDPTTTPAEEAQWKTTSTSTSTSPPTS